MKSVTCTIKNLHRSYINFIPNYPKATSTKEVSNAQDTFRDDPYDTFDAILVKRYWSWDYVIQYSGLNRKCNDWRRQFATNRERFSSTHPYYTHTRLFWNSFYNFRMRHLERDGKQHLPVPDKLIGECIPEGLGVCTDRGNFHVSLATFGKTNMTDPSERNLLRMRDKYQFISPIDNPVFLYDVAQLYDTNTTRTERFKSDFQHFLGLTKPMPEPKNGTAIRPKKKTIDICQPEFDKVREVLLENGKRASMWIRKYFMQSDQVYVSSRYFFEEALKEWKVDPCLTRTASS